MCICDSKLSCDCECAGGLVIDMSALFHCSRERIAAAACSCVQERDRERERERERELERARIFDR